MLEEKTKERITDDRCREEMASHSSRGETIHRDGRLQDDAVTLVNRVNQLEKQVQQLQMQQLEAEKRYLEEQLERERRKVDDVMKERDEALSARDAAVMRLDDVLVRAKPVKVGFANYGDLEKLSSDDRRRLETRLDLFARSVLEMADEHQWGREIPSGLRSLLADFSVGYEDCSKNVSTELRRLPSIKSEGKLLRDSNKEAALLLIMDNRCHLSNQHQNCLLVVEALITLRDVRLWLS
jgi:ElaB/YqjD/DUF883 family membrane-anchored ribosome-binding protein